VKPFGYFIYICFVADEAQEELGRMLDEAVARRERQGLEEATATTTGSPVSVAFCVVELGFRYWVIGLLIV
jgi:hypothetical protein